MFVYYLCTSVDVLGSSGKIIHIVIAPLLQMHNRKKSELKSFIVYAKTYLYIMIIDNK